MKARSQGKEFVVVTKVPKRYWHIPRLDARVRLQELERELEALQRLAEGTTLQGRELSRKLLFACERCLREGKSIPDMAVAIEPQMQESAMPHPWLKAFQPTPTPPRMIPLAFSLA